MQKSLFTLRPPTLAQLPPAVLYRKNGFEFTKHSRFRKNRGYELTDEHWHMQRPGKDINSLLLFPQ